MRCKCPCLPDFARACLVDHAIPIAGTNIEVVSRRCVVRRVCGSRTLPINARFFSENCQQIKVNSRFCYEHCRQSKINARFCSEHYRQIAINVCYCSEQCKQIAINVPHFSEHCKQIAINVRCCCYSYLHLVCFARQNKILPTIVSEIALLLSLFYEGVNEVNQKLTD